MTERSLHSAKAPLPLTLTETLMRKILTRHNVDQEFLHVLFAFGTSPNESECGSSNLSIKTRPDGSKGIRFSLCLSWLLLICADLSYQIRYVEENYRSPEQPWSVRQTGVYQYHSATRPFDFFIFLHPLVDSLLEQHLTHLDVPEATSFCQDPYRLHALPFAAYLDNWRWYLRDLGEDFQSKVRGLAFFRPLTM